MRTSMAKFPKLPAMIGGLLAAAALATVAASCGGNSNTGARTPGTGGAGNTAGAGGATGGGTGGSGPSCTTVSGSGPFTCGSGMAVAPPGSLTDFSPTSWNNMGGKWCNSKLTGSLFNYAGQSGSATGGATSTSMKPTVDLAAQNLDFMAMVLPNGYAGFGMAFDSCADVSAFTGVKFMLSGSTGGCDLQLQLQTLEQRPTDQSPPGTCDASMGSCFNFPAKTMLTLPASATDPAVPETIMFTDMVNWDPAKSPTEIVGLQWQLTAPGTGDAATNGCMVDMRIDDVAFF